MNFVEHIFNEKFFPKLGKRADTFLKVFEYLDSLESEEITILETGVARKQDNWEGDGMSTLMFDEFANFSQRECNFTSIDINPENVIFARSKVSEKTELFCRDSVSKLREISLDANRPMIDVLYLDSYDLDFDNPGPSCFHHIKEFLAILPKLKKGALIIVDDNAKGTGKGAYIKNYMENIGVETYFDEYQIAWIYE